LNKRIQENVGVGFLLFRFWLEIMLCLLVIFFSWVAICSSKLAIFLILLFGGLQIAGFCLFEFLLSDFQIGYN
jgi:hypothetical protein